MPFETGAALSGAAFSIGSAAAAGPPHPSVVTVPVLANVLLPLKLAGTSLSPTAASLMTLWETLAAKQLNSTAAVDDSVIRLPCSEDPGAFRETPSAVFMMSFDCIVAVRRSTTLDASMKSHWH